MAKDPTTVANLWASRLTAATPEIQAGVQAVTTAPGQLAAAAADVWLQRLTASKAKFQRNVSAITLTQWQQATIQKGIPRIAEGANAAIPKMQNFMSQWLPHVESVAQTVRAMPKGTIDQGIARATAQIRGNANFTYNR